MSQTTCRAAGLALAAILAAGFVNSANAQVLVHKDLSIAMATTIALTAVDNCKAIGFWGVGDYDSQQRWGAAGHPNERPLLFDENYNPKPVYHGVVDALNGR